GDQRQPVERDRDAIAVEAAILRDTGQRAVRVQARAGQLAEQLGGVDGIGRGGCDRVDDRVDALAGHDDVFGRGRRRRRGARLRGGRRAGKDRGGGNEGQLHGDGDRTRGRGGDGTPTRMGAACARG